MTLQKTNLSSQINWNNLKENPWAIFKNYNPILDNSLHKLSHLCIKYNEIEHLIFRKKNEMLSQKNLLKDKQYLVNKGLNDYEALILTTIFLPTILLIASGIFIYSSIETFFNFNIASSLNLIMSILTLILPFSSIYLSLSFAKNKSMEKIEQSCTIIQNDINQLENELFGLSSSYNKEVQNIMKPSEYLDIREHLNYYYQTDIFELNNIIQNILEDSFPKSKKNILPSNIQDVTQSLSPTYVKKIDEYLSNVIESRTAEIISDKLFHLSSQHSLNSKQKPDSHFFKNFNCPTINQKHFNESEEWETF